MAKDNKENYAVNGGLLITWEELGDRLIEWENFINKFPKSPLIKKAKENYHNYLLDYLWEWIVIESMIVKKEKFMMIKEKHTMHSSKNIQTLLQQKN
jgi:hypothetical protein